MDAILMRRDLKQIENGSRVCQASVLINVTLFNIVLILIACLILVVSGSYSFTSPKSITHLASTELIFKWRVKTCSIVLTLSHTELS
jgi:hypothetical protein